MAESDAEVQLEPAVLAAVAALAPRMTLGDVLLQAPAAALDSKVLRRQLVAIAHLSGGHLEAVHGGEVVYVLPRTLHIAIQRRSAQERRRAAIRKGWQYAGVVLRIAFGVFLFGSIFLAIAAITVIVIIALSQRRGGHSGPILPISVSGGGGGGGGGGGPGLDPYYLYGNNSWRDMWLLMYMMENNELRRRQRLQEDQEPLIVDPVKPAPVPDQGGGAGGGRGDNNGGGDGGGGGGGGGAPPPSSPFVADLNASGAEAAEPEAELSLIEAVFAFVFGRGDTNADMEKRRWRAIGLLLRHNKGAVFAEQVAPFLDAWLLGYESSATGAKALWQKLQVLRGRREETPSDPSRMHEGYMLPVLQRFGGHAESSEDGRLVYVFPHLQVTAAPNVAPEEAGSSSSTGSVAVPDVSAPPPVPPPIYERLQRLSDGGSKQPQVIALGLANVILLLIFRRIGGLKFGAGMTAQQILESDREIGPLLLALSYLPALLAWLFKPLLCYAIVFFAVPATRYFVNLYRNQQTTKRNLRRRARALQARQMAASAAAEKGAQARSHQSFQVLVQQ